MLSKIRWSLLVISFIVLTYGVYLFGVKINNGFELPTFAYPINQEGLVRGSCYNLAHTGEWFTQNLAAGKMNVIITFIAGNLLLIFLLGRSFCGFICPFGFIQDLLDKFRQMLRLKSFRWTEKQYKWVSLFKWEFLAIFLGLTYLGISFCSFCPIIAIVPPLAGREINVTISGILAVIVMAGAFLKRRFWCNICPMGLLVGLFYKVSLFRLKKDCQACTECGACYEACPMGIKSIYTERQKSDITTMDCLMCAECINKCPEKNALSLAVARWKIFSSSRSNFFADQGLKAENTVKQNIDKLF
ncbi:MAG TPA: 4Fe-4S binding protein [Bacillota bacterium]|nr:4Fe-4S binding protein [Bacillota bacterium]